MERVERPANAPDPNHPLLLAARYNDAEAEDQEGVEPVLRQHGLEPEAVRYTAEQRALRYVMHMIGRGDEINVTGAFRVELSGEETALVRSLAALVLDGIAIGWRANNLERQSEE